MSENAPLLADSAVTIADIVTDKVEPVKAESVKGDGEATVPQNAYETIKNLFKEDGKVKVTKTGDPMGIYAFIAHVPSPPKLIEWERLNQILQPYNGYWSETRKGWIVMLEKFETPAPEVKQKPKPLISAEQVAQGSRGTDVNTVSVVAESSSEPAAPAFTSADQMLSEKSEQVKRILDSCLLLDEDAVTSWIKMVWTFEEFQKLYLKPDAKELKKDENT